MTGAVQQRECFQVGQHMVTSFAGVCRGVLHHQIMPSGVSEGLGGMGRGRSTLLGIAFPSSSRGQISGVPLELDVRSNPVDESLPLVSPEGMGPPGLPPHNAFAQVVNIMAMAAIC